MARDYTTLGLIENIKRRANFHTTPSFGPDRILAYADDELQTVIVPLVRAHRNNHFVDFKDVTTTTSLQYDIPPEAINRGLYNVAMLTSNGDPYALIPIDFDREIDFHDKWNAIQVSHGSGNHRLGYYVRGDKLHLYNGSQSMTAGKTLRLYFERLPNQIVETSECALVASVDQGTGIVTTSGGVPTSFTTSTPLCCVSGKPGFGLKFENTLPTESASPTLTFADVSEIEPGDWIALDGDSPIPQIPVELHPLLAQAACVKVLESMGDDYLPIAQQKWSEAVMAYKDSYTLRVEQAPKRIYSRNKLSDWMT